MPSIYQEIIMDHHKYPRNKKKIEDASVSYGDQNPVCGDDLTFYLKMDETEKITDIGFQGTGCAISQATASILTELIEDMSTEDIQKMTNDDVVEILGIPITPVRLKCAILSLKVLQGAILKHQGHEVGSSIADQEV